VPGPDELVPALADGYRRAQAAVDSGAAADLLQRWITTSKRLGAESKS
jgi:anthranilate phosphoribosyltransferase